MALWPLRRSIWCFRHPIPVAAQASVQAPKAAPAETVPAEGFALASVTSTPAEISPVKVKTIPMVFREDRLPNRPPNKPPSAPQRRFPFPRRRPASRPSGR